jgi:hypothetical protein
MKGVTLLSDSNYKSKGEIEAIVRGFESCATSPAEFSHSAHLTVAFSYLHLSHLTVAQAAERMRASLYRFLSHHGVDSQKYNETITLFWIKLVRGFLDNADTDRPVEEVANEMIETCDNSRLIYDYYSKERLASEEARTAWIEPDLKALDFERSWKT